MTMQGNNRVWMIVTGALIAMLVLPAAQGLPDPYETLEDQGVETGRGQVFCGEVAGTVYHCDYVLNRFPEAPHDPTPPDGSQGQPKDITLSWKSVDKDDADSVTYTVKLDPEADVPPGADPETVVCEVTDRTSCRVLGLAPEVTYKWQVVARDAPDTRVGPFTAPESRQSTSDVWAFETASNAIIDLAPIHGAEEVPRPITLTWARETSTMTRYEVYLATDPDFERTVDNRACLTFDTSCDPSGKLDLDTTYHWEVVAEDGTQSGRQRFEVFTTTDIAVSDDDGPAYAVMSDGNVIRWYDWDPADQSGPDVETYYSAGDAIQINGAGCVRTADGNVRKCGSYDGGDAIDLDHDWTCLLQIQGTVKCESSGVWQDSFTAVDDAIDFETEYHCVVHENGDVNCDSLQTMDDEMDRRGIGAVEVDGGSDHVCALVPVTDGAHNARCWLEPWEESTSEDFGQDGDRLTGDVEQVAAYDYLSCALVTSGDVDCWGEFSGTADYNGGDAAEVELGHDVRCVRLASGPVDCTRELDNSSDDSHLDFS